METPRLPTILYSRAPDPMDFFWLSMTVPDGFYLPPIEYGAPGDAGAVSDDQTILLMTAVFAIVISLFCLIIFTTALI